MIRSREFWYCLVLLVLVIGDLVFLKTIDAIGQYWVHRLHDYARGKGVSDEMIYAGYTRKDYILFGSILALLMVSLGIEIYFLTKRLRAGISSELVNWVFGVAIMPPIYLTGRALLHLHQLGRFL